MDAAQARKTPDFAETDVNTLREHRFKSNFTCWKTSSLSVRLSEPVLMPSPAVRANQSLTNLFFPFQLKFRPISVPKSKKTTPSSTEHFSRFTVFQLLLLWLLEHKEKQVTSSGVSVEARSVTVRTVVQVGKTLSLKVLLNVQRLIQIKSTSLPKSRSDRYIFSFGFYFSVLSHRYFLNNQNCSIGIIMSFS